jgi:hypothetical protein
VLKLDSTDSLVGCEYDAIKILYTIIYTTSGPQHPSCLAINEGVGMCLSVAINFLPFADSPPALEISDGSRSSDPNRSHGPYGDFAFQDHFMSQHPHMTKFIPYTDPQAINTNNVCDNNLTSMSQIHAYCIVSNLICSCWHNCKLSNC